MNTSQQCALAAVKAKHVVRWTNTCIGRQMVERHDFSPLFYAHLVAPGKVFSLVLSSLSTKKILRNCRVQQRDTKMIGGRSIGHMRSWFFCVSWAWFKNKGSVAKLLIILVKLSNMNPCFLFLMAERTNFKHLKCKGVSVSWWIGESCKKSWREFFPPLPQILPFHQKILNF